MKKLIMILLATLIVAGVSSQRKINVRDNFYLDFSTGAFSNISGIEKFGKNATVAATTQETIWEGSIIYEWLGFGQNVKIVSTSNNDSITGTAANTIYVEGLDSTGYVQMESIDMAGTDTVNLLNKFRSVYRMYVEVTDGFGTNEGTITLWDDTGDTLLAQINPSIGQTNMCVYQIPLGYTGYLASYDCSITRVTGVSAVACDFDIYQRTLNGALRSVKPLALNNLGSTHADYDFKKYPSLPALTQIEIRATPTGIAAVTGGFMIYLIKE